MAQWRCGAMALRPKACGAGMAPSSVANGGGKKVENCDTPNGGGKKVEKRWLDGRWAGERHVGHVIRGAWRHVMRVHVVRGGT